MQAALSRLLRCILAAAGMSAAAATIRVWDGRLSLRQLQLDPNAVDRLGLPLACTKGAPPLCPSELMVPGSHVMQFSVTVDDKGSPPCPHMKLPGLTSNHTTAVHVELLEAQISWRCWGMRSIQLRLSGLSVGTKLRSHMQVSWLAAVILQSSSCTSCPFVQQARLDADQPPAPYDFASAPKSYGASRQRKPPKPAEPPSAAQARASVLPLVDDVLLGAANSPAADAPSVIGRLRLAVLQALLRHLVCRLHVCLSVLSFTLDIDR